MGYALIVNPGSSSKKYALYNQSREVLRMHFEQTGHGFEVCTQVDTSRQLCEGIKESQFTHAVDAVLAEAVMQKLIVKKEDVELVCVRIVAPGTFFQKHQEIDDAFIHALHAEKDAAPLHIPSQLYEIETLKQSLPHARFLGISDSAFHATLNPSARNYAIPHADAARADIYRFGYHGISVASVVRKAPQVYGELPKRMVVCHIGSGVSVTAVQNGNSFDTTMGYAPGSGLVMGTRAGDVDAGALLALMRTENMRVLDAQMYIQTRGGLLARAGESDLRKVLEACAHKNEEAQAAFDMYVYHIRKAIGSYVAALGGVDAVVLTATASERNSLFRKKLLSGMEALGIVLSDSKNDTLIGKTGIISDPESSVTVAVVVSDEIKEMYSIAETEF
jgi:acetate kinase